MEILDNNELEEFGNVAPTAQHNDQQDQNTGTKPSELFGCLDDEGIFPRTNDDEELVVKRMDDCSYRQLVRSLNRKQMEFFYHVLYSMKTSDQAQRLFLSGVAGVGKTTVTNALYEAL